MNQTISTILLIIFFSVGVQQVSLAQADLIQNQPYTKTAFIEANISVNTSRNFDNSDSDNFNAFLFTDTIGYTLFAGNNYEIQFRYTKEFTEHLSWYGGIYLGQNRLIESIQLLDGIRTFTPGTGTGTLTFPQTEVTRFENRKIYYGSIAAGLRVSKRVFKNDRLYFSFGGKLNVYPKRDLSLSTPIFSTLLDETFIRNSSSTLDNDTRFLGSMDIDFSYHLVLKNEKFRFLVGILADRSTKDIFEITNDIVLPTVTRSFEESFGGPYVGIYFGFAYVLDSTTL